MQAKFLKTVSTMPGTVTDKPTSLEKSYFKIIAFPLQSSSHLSPKGAFLQSIRTSTSSKSSSITWSRC